MLLFTNADWREPAEFIHHCSTKWGYHLPGMSAFARQDGGVYHTYSTYGRGLEFL